MNPHPSHATSSDSEARLRIRESIGESLIVEASAGTGKTTELVSRIVAVLKTGTVRIQQIAAVTFTHKAAGEMKLRLRTELDKERAASPQLEEPLAHLEEASIGTIHSFCAQILRERPVEAGIDPAFEELNESESDRIYQRAFRAWMERRLNEDSPGLKRAFARLAFRDSWDDTPPIEQLQYAGRKLIEWRDYGQRWARDDFARDPEINELLAAARELAGMSARPRRVNDNLYVGTAPARLFTASVASSEQAGPRDYDGLEARILKLGRDLARDPRRGSGAYGEGVAREDLVARRDQLLWRIDQFRRRADADLAPVLRDEMAGLVEEYKDRKRRAGKLDFVDLLLTVRDLIRDQQPVRNYLQKRFTHLFIDEFQDTDPLQAELLLLLSAGDPLENDWRRVTPAPGKLFVVGDPKQSIYKFRRADMVLYREIRDRLVDRGVGLVRLTRSFRSLPGIQQLVNAAFEPEMDGDAEAGRADWAPLEPHRPEISGQPSTVVLPVPRPYGARRIAKDPIQTSLPDAIAAFTHWLTRESNWGRTRADGSWARFEERDIAILLRRGRQAGKDLTREYARALEARHIPHLLGASRSFHRREEVETLRSALAAIEWPDDEMNVFAALKGSLFAIPDDLLLRYRHHHGPFNPVRKIEGNVDAAFWPITEALAILCDLHRRRNYQSFSTTVSALLEATRAHAAFLLRPGGQQVLANVTRVIDLARSFEITGGISFRGFVEELEAQAGKEDSAEAPVLEAESDGVRVMTVHSAKGLEFPVVILADLAANLAAREPDHYIDAERGLCATRLLRCAPRELADHEPLENQREQAEGVRVAYVAATRAMDLLVIPAIGDEPYDGWLSPLNKAIYPTRANWRRSHPAPGCPPFGNATVVERPLEFDRQEEMSVHPGLVTPERGDHPVVWWDPSRLVLGVQGGFGTSHEEILKHDGGSLAAYQSWQADRARALESGSRPQFDVFIASQAASDPPGDPIPVHSASVERAPQRPAGRRFGTLVHAVMRDAALDAGGEQIEKLTGLNARILGAPEDETRAASAAVAAALRHPLLSRARAAARLHREYPVVLKLDGNRLLEGVIDLAFVENGAWVVVDFKTGADSTLRMEQYERQLRWYAHALAKATGMPAQGWLLEL